ncbi:cell division protein ZapC domain-containing protein [Ferrimonas pelagia]|uniref:Cell division protein ZapC n=1 Tax=Ferrimonas pelagia TaxID=1177826 RepID=A0ABP9F9Q3_9GAMM
MSLMPEQTWKWFYHIELNKLAIQLGGHMAFLSGYSRKQIIPDGLYDLPFSAEHANYYQDCVQKLEQQLPVEDTVRVQLALNMTAARFFSLPMMPKSWHFKSSPHIVYATQCKLVTLQTEQGRHQFIVIEAYEQCALLMLVDATCPLKNGKSLSQFALIKVMNDRLMPAMQSKTIRIVAA